VLDCVWYPSSPDPEHLRVCCLLGVFLTLFRLLPWPEFFSVTPPPLPCPAQPPVTVFLETYFRSSLGKKLGHTRIRRAPPVAAVHENRDTNTRSFKSPPSAPRRSQGAHLNWSSFWLAGFTRNSRHFPMSEKRTLRRSSTHSGVFKFLPPFILPFAHDLFPFTPSPLF